MSPRRRRTKRRKSGRGQRFRRLLLFVLIFVVGNAICNLWALPEAGNWLKENAEESAMAMESTAIVLLTPIFGPDHVFLSLGLQNLAGREGISKDHLREIVAAAANVTIRGEEETFEEWLVRVYDLAALLFGVSKVESSYCKNIGGGVAYKEVEKRIERIEEELAEEGKDDSPGLSWWKSNLTALEQIASELRVGVKSIPGSIGAGAISCFQLMPVNWLRYGGGDYEYSFQAAMNSARYLKAHGYPDEVEKAVLSYNPNAEQPYVDDVLAGRAIWQFPVTTAAIEPPVKLNVLTFAMVFTEFLAWYTGDYQVAAFGEIGPFAVFVHPYPGSHPVSYFWKQPVFVWDSARGEMVWVIDHPGQDWGGISEGPIVAAHPGRVTFRRYLCPNSYDPKCKNDSDPSLAAKWWISGVTVIIRGDLELPDGSQTPVCTGYGHGKLGSLDVSVGEIVSAGQKLMDAGTTGSSSGIHLHFFVIIGGSGDFCDGGKFFDPNQYVK